MKRLHNYDMDNEEIFNQLYLTFSMYYRFFGLDPQEENTKWFDLITGLVRIYFLYSPLLLTS